MNAKKVKTEMLDKEIIKVYRHMDKIEDPSTDEYLEYADRLERLIAIEKTSKEANCDRARMIEAIVKTGIPGAFGLIQILSILKFEKLDVLYTKALGFVLRGRA